MRKLLKNALSFLLVSTMILGIIGLETANGGFKIKAEAATEYTSGYYTYTVENAKAKITGFDDTVGGSVNIPSSMGGYSVTEIGDFAFYLCDNVTSVSIPNSVTSIGDVAFYGCSSLTKVNMSDNVISIGSKAFSDCSSLANITLSDNLSSISNELFNGCRSMTTITIPDGVTSIGNHAFLSCNSLTKVTLPDSVTSIGEMSFENCSSLTRINIPNSVLKIGAYAFNGCSSLVSIDIPESVISIGENTFGGCTSITKVVIPESITGLNNMLFAGCSSLTKVTIPDSVLRIGDSVFSGCSALDDITIPDSVLSMGDYVFSSCDSLSSIVIPDGITSVGKSVFWLCNNLKNIVIPDSIMSIGEYAFNYCSSLTDVYYTGSEEDWNAITISDYNESILNATIHYNYDPSHSHLYKSSVTTDATCTKFGIKTYVCECGNTYTETIAALGHKSGDWQIITEATTEKEGKRIKKCTLCGITVKEEIVPRLEISNNNNNIVKEPSKTSISYGDAIILHTNLDNIPTNVTIKWTANNSNFDTNVSNDGKSCKITPKSSGSTTFTVTVFDEEGNILSTGTQEMKSKAGFFDKIVAFFKGVFGLNKTYFD